MIRPELPLTRNESEPYPPVSIDMPIPPCPRSFKPRKSRSLTRCHAIHRLLSAKLPDLKPTWLSVSEWLELSQNTNLVGPITFEDDTLILVINRKFDELICASLGSGLHTIFRWWFDAKKTFPKLEIKNKTIDTNTIGRKIKLPPALCNNEYLHHLAAQDSLDHLIGEINLFFHSIVQWDEKTKPVLGKRKSAYIKFVVDVETQFLRKWEAEMNKIKSRELEL
jgi:hypothetical protein